MPESPDHGLPAGKHRRRHRVPPLLGAMRAAFATLGPVMPGFMGRLAYRLWFRTHRYPAPPAERAVAQSSQRLTLRVGGTPVAVYSWGEGPVVAFVHGWAGRGTQGASFIDPLCAAGYRLIAFDAPGHGQTPGSRTTILEIAAVLEALAAEYGPISGAITHSFGGMVLAYAMNHDVQVGRAVCISAPARVEFLIDRFSQTLTLPAAVTGVLRRRIEQRFANDIWEKMSTDSNARQLMAPALIIHDADDPDVPWQQGEQIAEAWPGARFLKTRGLGHRRILRDPATVASTVDFITGGRDD